MTKLKCLKCGHEWVPRVENPRACPGCQTIRYNKEQTWFRIGSSYYLNLVEKIRQEITQELQQPNLRGEQNE
ncbi:MAG: hypothetical protein ABSG44_09985 [Thermodesulfobacteriota bacterium]